MIPSGFRASLIASKYGFVNRLSAGPDKDKEMLTAIGFQVHELHKLASDIPPIVEYIMNKCKMLSLILTVTEHYKRREW